MSFLGSLVANPALVLQHRNIFLLSHMRANTSLFGHLIGSHPLVEGYYEMHIGYYSWKSLWRQKLRHFATHDAKPGARFMFDKVLHDGHHVETALLRRQSSRTIVMLRSPEQSIKSLIVLYREHSPHLPEATAEGAARYYIDRLNNLVGMADAIGPRYFYLDAECLVAAPERTLATLSDWLALGSPIPTEYETFTQTGRGNTGDHSTRLKSGKINKVRTDYGVIDVPSALLEEARQTFEACRSRLSSGSAHSVLA